jgi:hypothetical protein
MEPLDKKRTKHSLNFDQLACAHLLLQMNRCQSLFDFQVITIQYFEGFRLPTDGNEDLGDLLEWLDGEVFKFESSEGKEYKIDYWLGITSMKDGDNWFFRNSKRERCGKELGIITSYGWEEMHYSPPSLFEYVTFSVFVCSLYCLNRDYNGPLRAHKYYRTKGCILDFFPYKQHIRILISNPYLCSTCRNRLMYLQGLIKEKEDIEPSLYEEINRVLSREWMGSLERQDSPIYNLKKNYGYDLDRNSGFYKKPLERLRDSIVDNSAEWIIGGIITAALSLIGAYFGLGD